MSSLVEMIKFFFFISIIFYGYFYVLISELVSNLLLSIVNIILFDRLFLNKDGSNNNNI